MSLRLLHSWLLAFATAAVLAHSGVPSTSGSLALVRIAAAAIAVIVAMRFAVLAAWSHELAIGSRARAHRQALGGMPAPQDPRTAGRPRTRAPAQSITVTPSASTARTSVMDPFSIPPLAALLEGAYHLLAGLTGLLHPIAAASSSALAVLLVTAIVRALLVRVGISQMKAEGTRRRLHPQLLELQQRHRQDPVMLQRKSAELYRAENSSPFAGILPALAQAPVLSVVYTLFVRTSIDGHANALLDQHLLSAPLGASFLQVLVGESASVLVYLAVFAVRAPVAVISRRIALNLQLVDPAAPASAATVARTLSWLPFVTIVFAGIVPSAAALYLTASATWTLGERMLLRRWYRAAPSEGGIRSLR